MADASIDSGPGHWVTLPGGHAVYINDASGKAMPPPAQGGAEAVKAGHAYVVAQKQEAAESAAKAASIAANEIKAGGAIITTAKAGTITAWQGHSMSAVVKAAGSLGLGHSATVGLLNSLGFSATAHSVKYTDLKKGKESHPLSPGELDSLKGAVTEFQAKGVKAGNATVTASGAGGNWKTINGHPVLLDESWGAGQGIKAGGAYVIPSGAKATPAQAAAAKSWQGEAGPTVSGAGGEFSEKDMKAAKADVQSQIDALEEAGEDDPDNFKYAALNHIAVALDAHFDTPLSKKQYVRTAFTFNKDTGKVLAGGAMTLGKDGKAEITDLGSVAGGAGGLALKELIKKAQEAGVNEISLVSTAKGFYQKYGFESSEDGGMVLPKAKFADALKITSPAKAEPAPAKEPAATTPAKEPAATTPADASGQHWVTINGHKVLLSDAVAAIDHLAAGEMPSAFTGDQKAMEGVVHAVANYKTAGLGEDVAPETNKLLGDLPVEAYNKFVDLSLGPPKPLGDTEQNVDKQAELAGHDTSATDAGVKYASGGQQLKPWHYEDAATAFAKSQYNPYTPESPLHSAFEEVKAAHHDLVKMFKNGGTISDLSEESAGALNKLPNEQKASLISGALTESKVPKAATPAPIDGPASVSALEGLSKSALLTHAGASGLTHAEAVKVMAALGHDASKMYNAFNAGKKGKAASKLTDEQAKAFAELHAQENGGKSPAAPAKAEPVKATAPPVAEPTNVHTPTKVAFPDSLSQVTEVKSLGGSTGAKLVEDKSGNQFVQKAGKGPAQIKSEFAAEKMYQALGVPVPESKMVTGPNGEPVKLSAYLPDTQELGKLSGKELETTKALASQHFVADALMANWDAAGMSKDNMVLGKDGKLYRIDMGGALAYRAQGAPKGDKFGDVPMELFTLKDAGKNPASADVFSKVSGKDIQGQINNVLAHSNEMLKATPIELKGKMRARLDNLEKIGNAYGEAYKAGLSDEQAQSHALATAEALSKGEAPPAIGNVKDQGSHYSNPVTHAYNAESHLSAPISEKLDAVWNKLPSAEKAGVHKFTGSYYSEMRSVDQGESTSSLFKEHLQSMYKAYEKLPKFEGMIYRGLHSVPLEKLKAWQSGMEYPAEAMSSYSRKLEVARSNFGRTHSSDPQGGKYTSVVFKLQSQTARVIDKYGIEGEKEVFVGKGLKMQIDKAYWGTFGDQKKSVWIVEGREVAPAPKRVFKD